jgi:uncharacterized membrane protein YoaK (UPF0700 family)
VLEQTQKKTVIARLEWILYSTAFAAGAVDIIGFTKLGGVFASAMTGNLALLAYHVAEGNSRSAIGSLIALAGFIVGCITGFRLRRGRLAPQAINLLLATETVLLLVAAGVGETRLRIIVLAVAMGLQAVVSQMTSLSTIVFTTTLTRLVGGLYDAFVTGRREGLKEVGTQVTLLASYFGGALAAGLLAVNDIRQVVLVPPAAVAIALAAHRLLKSDG